jgi:hypothetical protein
VRSLAFTPRAVNVVCSWSVSVFGRASGGQLLHIGGLKGHHKPVRSLAFTPGVRCEVSVNEVVVYLQ